MSLSCLNRIKRTSGSRPQAAADIQIIRFRIDRSGSMCSMKQEAIDGTYDYLKTSAETAYNNGSRGNITFGTFDDVIETVMEKASFHEVLSLLKDNGKEWIRENIAPRNMTKLRDAVIEDVNCLRREKRAIEENLSKEVSNLNPTIIVSYAVFTDGMDNQSRNSVEMMCEAVKAARDEDIICMFLAANQDACSTGQRFGFSSDHSLNVASHGSQAESGFRSATTATQRAVTDGAFAPPGSALRQSSCAFTQCERRSSQEPTQRSTRRQLRYNSNPPAPMNPPTAYNLRTVPTQNYRSGRQSPLNPYRTQASRLTLLHQGLQ